MDTSKVVEKLKEYMEANKLSQKQLAAKLGWTPGDLGAILGGHKTVGKNRLLHISKTLGIAFEFTIGGLRRTEALTLRAEDANLKSISALLGHTDIRTTLKYAHSDIHGQRLVFKPKGKVTELKKEPSPERHRKSK